MTQRSDFKSVLHKKAGYLALCIIVMLMAAYSLYKVDWSDVIGPLSDEVPAANVVGPLLQNDVIYQNIECDGDNLASVSIMFATYGRTNTNDVYVNLSDEDGEICHWTVNASDLEDNAYYEFKLPKTLSASAGKSFLLSLSTNATVASNAITVYTNLEDTTDVSQILNTNLSQPTVCAKLCRTYFSETQAKFFMAFFGMLLVLTFCMIGFWENLKIEKRFLILFLLTGVMYLIMLPYPKIPDELEHFYRAFEISSGHFISAFSTDGNSVGWWLPSNLTYPISGINAKYGDILSVLPTHFDSSSLQWYSFWNTALYAPISYLPQVVGIFIAKLFTTNVYAVVLSGRVSGFLFSAIVLYLCIRFIPEKKVLILLIAFFPMFMQEAVSLAGDSITNVLSLAIPAYALYLSASSRPKLLKRQFIIMLALSCGIALCKVVYLPLCFLFLLIPSRKFGSVKRYIAAESILIIAAVCCNFLWLSVSSGFLTPEITGAGVNSAQQVHYILTHPLNYFQTVANTIKTQGSQLILTCVGQKLGWLNIEISKKILLPYLLVLLFAAMIVKKDALITLKAKEKLIIGGVVITVCALIFTSLYVQWTPYKESVILGLQGRYFIPVVLLICLLLTTKRFKIEEFKYQQFLYPLLGYVQFYALLAIVKAMI